MRTPIYTGVLQSDIDFAGFKPLNADLSDYDLGGGGGGPNVLITVNVQDAPYNAAGDGVSDDTVAINTAIADVVAGGGGTVFFPRGIYLCNGAFDSTFKSILKIPLISNVSQSVVTLRLLGEIIPAWGVVGAATNYGYFSTIKTTRTDGMTAESNGFAAIIAGNVPLGNALHGAYADFNGVMVRIENMQFLCPSNPTMGGIRLDGVGSALLEHVNVQIDGVTASANPSEPTHGTTGVWMPNSINFGYNWLKYVNAGGFDTGFKSGELLVAPWVQPWACKNGFVFLEGMGPSQARIMCGNCVDAVRFLGYATVDLTLAAEHSPAADWTTPAHDIKDPSNYGMGIVRYIIGHGVVSNPSIAASVEGGTGLTLVDLCSGNISQNTTQGASGGAGILVGRLYATGEMIVGYTDTGLTRNNAGIVEINNGTPGTFRELLARSVKLNALTVATLPGSPSIGQVASVSDGTAALAWGATVTGGGSTKYQVFFNGTNWTVAGK